MVEELLCRAGESNLALLEEVRTVGDAEREVDRLFDHDDGRAGVAELGEQLA